MRARPLKLHDGRHQEISDVWELNYQWVARVHWDSRNSRFSLGHPSPSWDYKVTSIQCGYGDKHVDPHKTNQDARMTSFDGYLANCDARRDDDTSWQRMERACGECGAETKEEIKNEFTIMQYPLDRWKPLLLVLSKYFFFLVLGIWQWTYVENSPSQTETRGN